MTEKIWTGNSYWDIAPSWIFYPSRMDLYPAAKTAVLGKRPPWFVYLLTHNERSRGFKCYTYVGVSRNPFRKHMQHRMRALPQCKTTRPAAKHWVLAEVLGPFEHYENANEVRYTWKEARRGESGRHITGMYMVHLINRSSDSSGEDISIGNDIGDDLAHLEHYAKRKGLQMLVRCFSRTVLEPIPFSMLKNVSSTHWMPSTSDPLSMRDVERLTGKERPVKRPIPSPFEEDDEEERVRVPVTKRKKVARNRWGIRPSPFDDV